MPKFNEILYDVKNHIAVITLNRPEALNAWYWGMNEELKQVADFIDNDPDVRVAIITGAGEKSFCSGIDLKKLAVGEGSLDVPEIRDYYDGIRKMRDVFTMYERLPVPVIAAINGYCLGGGLEFALACDIRLAVENAVFSLPEVQLGIIPDLGGTTRLPKVVGSAKAKELIFTSCRFDAREALRIGLVQQIYPQGKLMEETLKMAGVIAGYDPIVVQAAKRVTGVAATYPTEVGLMLETTSSAFTIRSAKPGSSLFVKK